MFTINIMKVQTFCKLLFMRLIVSTVQRMNENVCSTVKNNCKNTYHTHTHVHTDRRARTTSVLRTNKNRNMNLN